MIGDQELVGLAMTLGRDAKIKITVSGDGSFCKPDGSHINIARMPSTPLGRMLMTGLVFHEIGQKNYTKGGRAGGFLGDMMNVIEDIRVDMETIKARPGTCFNLEAVTTHYINKGSLVPANLGQALLGKVMAYGFGRVLQQAAAIPLETQCNEMMDDAFGQDFIDDVDAIIKDIRTLRSTKDSIVMAQKLVALIVQQQKAQHKSPSSPSSGSPNSSNSSGSAPCTQFPQDGAEDHSQNGVQSTSNAVNSSHDDETVEDQYQTLSRHDKAQQAQAEAVQTSGAGGNGAGTGGGNRPTPDEIAEMLINSTGYGDLSALIQAELDDMAGNTPCDVKAGIPLLPEIGVLKPTYGKLNEVEAISASSKMRAKMMGMLQSIKMKPKSYGLNGRKLASSRLIKLATGDPRIFRKKIETIEANTAVVVLLDLSGSMSSRYQVANAAAFALHSTLFGLKDVAVCSLEFSGKNKEPEVNVLVGFGKKPLSENFNHHPFDGTPTDTAIWVGRAMLLQRPEPRKMMLILTDGCPDDDSDTQAATKRTMRDGIEIAAVGIMNNSVKYFWDNHRIINSINELPAAMFGIMEELLTKRQDCNRDS